MKRSILLGKAYSDHPGDKHLSVVLCQWGGEYVTWCFNKEDGGYFWGHYFDNLMDAVNDYNSRGVPSYIGCRVSCHNSLVIEKPRKFGLNCNAASHKIYS